MKVATGYSTGQEDAESLILANQELMKRASDAGISNEEVFRSGTFNDDVLDYGPEVAFAAQDLEYTIDQLAGNSDVLERVVVKSFDMMKEGDKYDVFINLYSLLPKSAQDKIATQGI